MVRQGPISNEIINLFKEKNADYIILGQPTGPQDEKGFTVERFEEFTQRLRKECQGEIVLAMADAGDCTGIKSFGVLEVPNRINLALLWNFFLSRLKKMGGHLVNP